MPLYRIAISAELGKIDRALCILWQTHLFEIDMQAFKIVVLLPKPPRSRVDKSAVVPRLCKSENPVSFKLSPTLVEYRPKTDRRVIIQMLDGRAAVLNKDLLCLFGAAEMLVVQTLYADRWQGSVAEKRVIRVVYKVLKYHHSETVAVVVKALGLDLDVLSESVEAERLHTLNVVGETVGCFGKEDAVLKISLIEQTVEEVRLAIEAHSLQAVDLLDLERAECKIGLDRVALCCDF